MGCTIRRATWAARNMYHNSWHTHHPWNTKHAIRTPLLDNIQFQRRSMTIFLCARSFFFSARGSFLSRCYSSLPLVSFTSNITKQMIHMIWRSPLRDGDKDGGRGGKIMIVKTQDLSTLNFCDYRFFAYFRFSSCYRIPESELTYFIFFFMVLSTSHTQPYYEVPYFFVIYSALVCQSQDTPSIWVWKSSEVPCSGAKLGWR